jgi:DNA-binding transcriptional ArsR family regulator
MAAPAVHIVEEADRAAVMLHPLRLRLLAELAEPDSATGLARRLGLPRQQLNYHLRQLEAQGLVEPVEQRKKRGCTEQLVRAVARSYLISPSTLGPLATDPTQIEDQVSSAYLVAVAARTIREVATTRLQAERQGKHLPTLTIQTEVRFATPKAQQAFAAELSHEIARLAAKYHDEMAEDGRRFRVMAGAYPVPHDSTGPVGPSKVEES